MNHVFTDPDLLELDRIWPLGQQLVVPEFGTIIVAGAYEGRYMHYLSKRFPKARVFGFEPQESKIDAARKYGTVYNYGLATANRSVSMGQSGTDGASIANLNGEVEFVEMRDAVEAIHLVAKTVDLAIFNMEGSEWALIPYLLDEMIHHRVKSMAIQFHPHYVSPEREIRVLKYLDEYYERQYYDYPIWTYWTLKQIVRCP